MFVRVPDRECPAFKPTRPTFWEVKHNNIKYAARKKKNTRLLSPRTLLGSVSQERSRYLRRNEVTHVVQALEQIKDGKELDNEGASDSDEGPDDNATQ